MSVQFGKCNFDGKPMDPKDLDQVRPVLASYGPDGEGCFCKENAGILYRAFHTTKESLNELQPHMSRSGEVITWDGRLDNREELLGLLRGGLVAASTDLEIVAAAYECWGTSSFAKLLGDWALSIWNPNDCSVTLAKDVIGTRYLYYSIEKDQATWCTLLDPLIQFSGHSFRLEEEYVAGWLSFFPATHLTPYAGIHSVSPSCFVRLARGKQEVKRYWDFDPGKSIRYGRDAEYEAHFRSVFGESVRRRLRSHVPVLAELSGGMDSSSIVCVADDVIAKRQAETPRLDTLSYYDDSEPSWNERPYFTKVEEQRGRSGLHIDVSRREPLSFRHDVRWFAATPDATGAFSEVAQRLASHMSSSGHRVVLSGIGGDEVTGGVPTPLPALGDLLARARFIRLARQLNVWALQQRRPWFHLLFDAVRAFLPSRIIGVPRHKRPAPWLAASFVKRQRCALLGYEQPLELLGPLPSFQENVNTLAMLRRQLGCSALSSRLLYEGRYPYLDRSLLEFLYAIPREQMVRPGQRRSLMRRALSGIVPDELLNRKRKAFFSRAPLAAVARGWSDLEAMSRELRSASLGLVDSERFLEALATARQGQLLFTVAFWRTVALEAWLRNLGDRVGVPEAAKRTAVASCRVIGNG